MTEPQAFTVELTRYHWDIVLRDMEAAFYRERDALTNQHRNFIMDAIEQALKQR